MEFNQTGEIDVPCDVSESIEAEPDEKEDTEIKNKTFIDTDRQVTRIETTDTKIIHVDANNEDKTVTAGCTCPEGTCKLDEDYNNGTYTITGTVGFCGTGNVDVTVTGASKPYAYIKKLDSAGLKVPNKFEFDSYYELDDGKEIPVYELGSDGKPTANIEKDSDGNDTYKIAQKSIYIDPYTYKYEEAEDGKYKVTIKLSNAVITGVEVMSDALAHPELSAHTRIVDGETGQVRPGSADEADHVNNLHADTFPKESTDKLYNIKGYSGQMYVINYPGDANLSIEDQEATKESGEVDSKEPISGTLTFTGGNEEAKACKHTGAIRKFFPFWRDSKFSYVSASSTTSATKLIMCEFSYPMNAILLFGQQSLSLGNESFYKYKWQDPAGAKNDSNRDVYDQAKALNKVTEEACAKLTKDYGSDNVRIYVVKYKTESYKSMPYYTVNTANKDTEYYSALEACASSTGGKSSSANDEKELKKRLDEIAEDIKKFASYKAVQVYDIDDQELENQGGKDQGGEQSK